MCHIAIKRAMVKTLAFMFGMNYLFFSWSRLPLSKEWTTGKSRDISVLSPRSRDYRSISLFSVDLAFPQVRRPGDTTITRLSVWCNRLGMILLQANLFVLSWRLSVGAFPQHPPLFHLQELVVWMKDGFDNHLKNNLEVVNSGQKVGFLMTSAWLFWSSKYQNVC